MSKVEEAAMGVEAWARKVRHERIVFAGVIGPLAALCDPADGETLVQVSDRHARWLEGIAEGIRLGIVSEVTIDQSRTRGAFDSSVVVRAS